METLTVISSAIAAIRYDEAKKRMWITFNTGKTYLYHGVSSSVVGAFLSAGSKGRFYLSRIKGRY